MQSIRSKSKSILKRSFFYKAYVFYRAKKALKSWTTQDQIMYDFYRQFIHEGDTCFDVGANLGNRTNIFLRCGANVVAIEPQKDCIFLINSAFRKNPNFHLIPKALGVEKGTSSIYISDSKTVSSMSTEWISKVKRTKRFGDNEWRKVKKVEVTTLDLLIKQFDIPSFIKIDVEGYEYEVLRGLSSPVKHISIEFTPEYFENTTNALEYLERLGPIRCNLVIGESFKFYLDEWVSPQEMINILNNFRKKTKLWGDIYIQYINL